MQEASIQWQSERSAGAWYQYVRESLATIHDHDLLAKFITVGTTGDQTTLENEPWLNDEQERISSYFTLLIELAAARSWSQTMFTNHWPHSFAVVCHPDRELAKQRLHQQQDSFKAILHAEEVLYDSKSHVKLTKSSKATLRTILDGVAFNQLQLCRELFVECEKDLWDPEHPAIQIFAKTLFGAPFQTKYTLEDVFAHLTSIGKLSSLATPMNKQLVRKAKKSPNFGLLNIHWFVAPAGEWFCHSLRGWRSKSFQSWNCLFHISWWLGIKLVLRWVRYFYCTTLPSLLNECSGWPQLKTSLEDHLSMHGPGLIHDSGKAFKSTDHQLPPKLRDLIVHMKMDQCKKAGTASNQKATACVAWLLNNASSDFKAVDMAWSGHSTALVVLMQFVEVMLPSDVFVLLCLGFFQHTFRKLLARKNWEIEPT